MDSWRAGRVSTRRRAGLELQLSRTSLSIPLAQTPKSLYSVQTCNQVSGKL
jgi:hypothetical protein